MKTMKTILSVCFLFVMAAAAWAQPTTWKYDGSHSNLGFSVMYMMLSDVEGLFTDCQVTAVTKGDDFADAAIEVIANVQSINTANEKRDNHLRNDDFFNAEKYPQMTFKSKSFRKVEGNRWKLAGDLTIRDVTKAVEFDVIYNGMVSDPWGNTRAGFRLTGTINRFDYGLKWNRLLETGGAVVGDTVTIQGNIQLIKQK